MPPTTTKPKVKPKGPVKKPLNVTPRGTAADGMVYPRYRVVVHANYPVEEGTQSAPPLTAEDMRELLGFEMESDDNKFEADPRIIPELTGLFGKRVRLTRNVNNRYVTPGWLTTLKQEHLNGRWRFNGASIVVGQFGNVQSGQHRGLSLILAEKEWRDEGPNGHWHKIWPSEPPSMEAVVVYGVKEDDDTFKTQNREKPGTLAEVMFRSEYLLDFRPSERKNAARALAVALDALWKRTGMGNPEMNPWTPKQTHGELMDLLRRHPRLVEALKYLQSEDSDGGVSRYLTLGNATAALYLMGTSASDPEAYTLKSAEDIEQRSERNLDFSRWDKAKEFWMTLASSTIRESTKEVRLVRRPRGGKKDDLDFGMMFPEKYAEGGNYLERYLTLANAWDVFKDGVDVKRKDVRVGTEDYYVFEYDDDPESDTYNHVTAVYLNADAEQSNVGGIDFGDGGGKKKGEKKSKVVNPEAITDGDDGEDYDEEVVADADGEEADETIPDDEAAEREAIQKRLEQERKKKDAADVSTAAGWYAKYRKLHPGKVILWDAGGEYAAWGEDADLVAKVTGREVAKHDSGLSQISFPKKELDETLRKLVAGKHKVMLGREEETSPSEYETVVKDAPVPKPKTGPAANVVADRTKKVLPAKDVKPVKAVTKPAGNAAAKPAGNGKPLKPAKAKK